MMSRKTNTDRLSMVSCPSCTSSLLPFNGTSKDGVFASTCLNCGHFFKFRASSDVKSSITFKVNHKTFTVGNEYGASTTLNEFLRRTGVSVGTKVTCAEGGCGVCLVVMKLFDPVLEEKIGHAVNSCCIPLYMCDGAEVTTIEGLGNPKDGLHPIQEMLAKKDGSQCGYCSPGQVMNMFGILKTNPRPTVQQVEDNFDATICRCTGYRPILDAMKTFCDLTGSENVTDIEDLRGIMCNKSDLPCVGTCINASQNGSSDNQMSKRVHIVNSDGQWLKPTSIDELVQLLKENRDKNYRLVFGNTGFGVYNEISLRNYDVLIDLKGIKIMYGIDFDPTIVLGGNLSITNLLFLFERSKQEPSMPYATAFAEHLKRVAMHGIRNLGSWAGNLMLKHAHNDFESDIFTLLETIGTKLIIYDGDGSSDHYSLPDFLQLDMKGKVIYALAMPTFDSSDVFVRTYKTALRLQGCHAYVNCGIMCKLDASQNYLVETKPSIVYSGINESFIHAEKTEGYLLNKNLGDPDILKTAIATLASEIVPASFPNQTSPAYRKSLAVSMFYRYVLDVCKGKVNPRYVSGGEILTRTPIVGTQDYGTQKTEWPLTEPMPKTTAQYLTSGCAKFLADKSEHQGELSAALVISTVAQADIVSIDDSAALAIPGVIAFIQAKDIPKGGVNNWRPTGIFTDVEEELLCSKSVQYAGQPIGIIVADLEITAQIAASLVNVKYSNIKEPVTNLQDAIQKKMFFPNPPPPFSTGNAKGAIASAAHKISGNISCGDQYHFYLDNQTTICEPNDVGGMKVEATSQWLDGVLETVAQVLGIPQNAITVEVERLGGAFGGKITQNFLVSGLCALAAYVVGSRVKLHLDIHTNMKMLGKRTPYYAEYQVGCDDDGKLLGILIDLYADVGMSLSSNEAFALYIKDWFDNAYYCPNWLWTPIPVKTNTPTNTACRSPGSLPFIFIMESIMENVAKALNKDQLTVRKLNLYVKGQKTPSGDVLNYCTIRNVVAQLETDIKLPDRQAAVDSFNKANRWRKRGLSVMPNRFGISWQGGMFNTSITIYHGDATVAIAHGGIDMGQGINTKVIQVCAYELGIPMDRICVKKSSTVFNGNSSSSGGSITSELCAESVVECCAILKNRMAPVKAKMVNPTWKELVHKCYEELIDLTAQYMTHPQQKSLDQYSCYSAACVEAELDVLTGQYQLRQLDMLYDCGESMNPELDVGQAEGGFVMGLGYFLQEQMKYDQSTGQVINATTWEYKPPMPKDLPMNFNIKFLRNAPNPLGVLSSKAVGEPPVTLAAAAVFAIKHAIEAARAEISKDVFFPLNTPATVEKVQMLCQNDFSNYTFGN